MDYNGRNPAKSYHSTPAEENEKYDENGRATTKEIMEQCGFNFLRESVLLVEDSKFDQEFSFTPGRVIKTEAECREGWEDGPFPVNWESKKYKNSSVHVFRRKVKNMSELHIARCASGDYIVIVYLPLAKLSPVERVRDKRNGIDDEAFDVAAEVKNGLHNNGPFALFAEKENGKWYKALRVPYNERDRYKRDKLLTGRDIIEFIERAKAELPNAEMRKRQREAQKGSQED
jgi:hypothetical protein